MPKESAVETSYSVRPSFRSLLASFLVHHNPFYLLSALCMVAGCFALNSDLATRSGELGKLLALIGTLNLYELILVSLGLYLIRRRGIIRDGRTLLLLEAPLLVDLAFLNAEVASVRFWPGLLINVLLLGLALAKVAVITRVLSGRWPRRAYTFMAVELAALFLLPSLFKHWEQGRSPSSADFYAAWWGAALLLVLFELMARFSAKADLPNSEPRIWITIRRIYSTLPFLSLIGHLAMLHWVYDVHFYGADAAPVLIGVAFLFARLRPANRDLRNWSRLVRVILPLAAILIAVRDPIPLQFAMIGRFLVTPTVITLAAAYLTFIYCFVLSYALYFLAAALAGFYMYLFGPTPQQILDAFETAWWRVYLFCNRFAPRTALQWGMVAMAGAFAFLGIGAAVSLRKPVILEETPAREVI